MKTSMFSLLALLLLSASLCTAEEPAAEPETSPEPEPEPHPVEGEPKAAKLGQEKQMAQGGETSAEPEPEPEADVKDAMMKDGMEEAMKGTKEGMHEHDAHAEPEPAAEHETIMPEKQKVAESAGSASQQQMEKMDKDKNGCSSIVASLAIVLTSVVAVAHF